MDDEEYLSEDFVEESLDDDEISDWEAWYIEGWKEGEFHHNKEMVHLNQQ